MVGETEHRLHFAAHQECILLSDQEPSVERNLRPAARCHQYIVKGAALSGGVHRDFFEVQPRGLLR